MSTRTAAEVKATYSDISSISRVILAFCKRDRTIATEVSNQVASTAQTLLKRVASKPSMR